MALNITNTTPNTLISGTAENDSIINLGDNVTIGIADGDNTILNGSDGGAADNVLISVGGGNNHITIQGGSDKATVITGDGNNVIESTSPNPLYITGNGNNSLTFYTGSDNGTMIAGDGDDVIRAVGYNVTINAGKGNDTIDTYRNAYYATVKPDLGDDVITFRGNYNLLQYNTGDGNDTLKNYTSNDSIQVNGEITSASLEGNDVVFYIGSGSLTITESNNQTINILDGEGNLTSTVFSGGVSTDTLANNTVISGTSGNDYLYIEGSGVTVNPGAGDDTVITFGDKGLITTGEGSNFVSVTASDNTVIAEEGSTNMVYFSNNETQGNSKNNFLKFGDGKNSIVTADLYSTVIGGASGDGITLHNGSGGSYIEGNGGSDTIAIGHNDITVYGGEGDDVINLYRDAENAIVNAGKGNDTITVYNNAHPQIYQYVSGDGNDVIRGQRGVEMIPGFDDDDTLQIVGVSSVETVISGDDIIFTFDDGGSITLAKSADNTINVEYQAQWTTVEGGGYKFTSPASFMVDTGSGPKFANFTLSGGNLTDEDNDGKPDSVVIGNVRYIQESGVHTNVNHLTGNVSYNDTLLGVENDDDYGIEAISPIDLSEEWPYNTYITDPNVTAIRGISTNATVSPRGGAGSVTAADWISVDDNSNVVFKDGVYCVYSESYFSSRNYTKLSIANGNKGVSVDTENSNISVIGGLQDGYEITIQSGKNVADEITFKTDGGKGVIVIQSTANSGKYSLDADSDEFINQRFTLSGDDEFKMLFGENGSVTAAEGFTGNSGSWSKSGANYIYSGVAINDFSQSASFTVSGSSLVDKDDDNAPDGTSVTAFGFNQTVGVMVGLDNVGGEITLNGSSVGVTGDDNYNVHFTAKVIDDASDDVIAYAKIKEVQHISDGATVKTNAGDIVMPDANSNIYLDSNQSTYLNNKYTDEFTLSAAANDTLDLHFMHFDSAASVTGDNEFTVKFDTTSQAVNLENFNGMVGGSGNIKINGTTATLGNTLAPTDVVYALRKSQITLASGTSTLTDVYGNKSTVKATSGKAISGSGILVGYGSRSSLKGGKNADVLVAKSTNATLTGGEGNDTFTGGSGAEHILITDYTEGEDVLLVATTDGIPTTIVGNDWMSSHDGKGTTVKGGANMTITVKDDQGNTRYYGNYQYVTDEDSSSVKTTSKVRSLDASARTQDVKLTGNTKANTLIGGSGANTLSGGSGDDYLVGGNAKNSLKGGNGADTLVGGTGNDTMSGGSGNDVFIYNGGNDLITDYTAKDTIIINSDAGFKASLNGSNVVLSIDEGTLTLKNGKNKTITLINESSNEEYEFKVNTKSKKFEELLFADDNFNNNELDDILPTKQPSAIDFTTNVNTNEFAIKTDIITTNKKKNNA